jgi:hypothetical protein
VNGSGTEDVTRAAVAEMEREDLQVVGSGQSW